MKLGVVITMYDEYEIVFSSIKNIKHSFPDAYIVVVQSEHKGNEYLINQIKESSNEFIILPNLGTKFHRMELPSQAICRNISKGCSILLNSKMELDLVIIFTGDTLITDATTLFTRKQEMSNNQWIAMVSQAIGHKFHASTDDPTQGLVENRYQSPDISDFACCFFLINGKIFKERRAFCDIKITNRWTSEQCLGDEMIRIIGDNSAFHKEVGILNRNNPYSAYSYNDGVVYHAKTGNPSR